MKTRIAIGILTGALIGLTAIVIREAQIIQLQRHLILSMWKYIQTVCAQ